MNACQRNHRHGHQIHHDLLTMVYDCFLRNLIQVVFISHRQWEGYVFGFQIVPNLSYRSRVAQRSSSLLLIAK